MGMQRGWPQCDVATHTTAGCGTLRCSFGTPAGMAHHRESRTRCVPIEIGVDAVQSRYSSQRTFCRISSKKLRRLAVPMV